MTTTTQPALRPGRVYRTRNFLKWASNPQRLTSRLASEGKLVKLGHGLFLSPKEGRFGPVPPTDLELLRAFLDGAPFVLTGPEYWNALGLGSTAVFATSLVYNTKRSGAFRIGKRRFLLRRVAFPKNPSPEWFVVDLFQHAEQAGVSREDLTSALANAIEAKRFDPDQLRTTARDYGTKDTQARIERALATPTKRAA